VEEATQPHCGWEECIAARNGDVNVLTVGHAFNAELACANDSLKIIHKPLEGSNVTRGHSGQLQKWMDFNDSKKLSELQAWLSGSLVLHYFEQMK
jgi:hypothetical protein